MLLINTLHLTVQFSEYGLRIRFPI